jgi:hypothetical protein
MTKALPGGLQYGCIVRDDLHRIAKGIEDAPARELHIAEERVLPPAG